MTRSRQLFLLLAVSLLIPSAFAAVLHAADSTATLTVGGTGGALGLMRRMGAVFAAQHSGSEVAVVPGLGSSGARRALQRGALDVAIVSHAGTSNEKTAGTATTAVALPLIYWMSLYRFQQAKLEELLSRRPPDGIAEARRILDPDGRVIAGSIDRLSGPLLVQSADVMDAGVKVAELTVARSMMPLIYQTGAVAAASVGLGAFLFLIVRLLPLRALNRALRENQKLITALEAQVVEIKAAESRLASLYEISSTTSATLDLTTVVQLLLDKVAAFMPDAALQIWLVNPKSGVPERAACRNLDEAEWKRRQLAHTPVLVEQALTAKAPVMVRDAQRDPRVADRDFYRRQGIVSYLGLPLVVNGSAVADFVVLTRSLHEFAPGEVEFLSAIASQAAVAIHKAQLHEQLRSQAEALTRSNSELEQFAYVASHDLQEPLRMITAYTTLLARRYNGRLDRDADEFIAFVVDGAKRMQELIQDLLSYSRLDKKDRTFSPCDCEATLAQTLGALKLVIEDSGGIVTHDPLPVVTGDATQLAQVFQNLIGNAIKYRADEPPVVHVSCAREGDKWHFSVKDNGIGIDPRFADRLFVIFQRLHTREEYPGSGLGLAICKRIVERHGGSIWVESEPRRGATFRFTIPVNPPAIDDHERRARGSGAAGQPHA